MARPVFEPGTLMLQFSIHNRKYTKFTTEKTQFKFGFILLGSDIAHLGIDYVGNEE